MPSIFIWKASTPNTSKNYITQYTGPNWILESCENYTKSYRLINQIVIPEFCDSVITFDIKYMPEDWVGNHLLEVTKVPYEFIKSDKYGTLEKIGNWMRFILNKSIEYNRNNIEKEIAIIKNWMNEKKETKNGFENQPIKMNIDHEKVQNDFAMFLNTYNLSKIKIQL